MTNRKSNTILSFVLAAVAFTSCNSYNQVYKSQDYDYKYETAKQCFAEGRYSQCYQLLEDLVMMLKGSDRGEESIFMLGMCYYNLRDYETASLYLDRYVKSYPKGEYAELARFNSACANYKQSPDPRLDQTATYTAINSLQEFLDVFPYSERKSEVNSMIYELQDRLVDKEYQAARLYYNLGSYTGNCTNGGSNYEASIITAENALRTYPYTKLREELSFMILRSRFNLANRSVQEKADERYRQTIDEYYGFKNEFPDSKYMAEADNIFRRCSKIIGDKPED